MKVVRGTDRFYPSGSAKGRAFREAQEYFDSPEGQAYFLAIGTAKKVTFKEWEAGRKPEHGIILRLFGQIEEALHKDDPVIPSKGYLVAAS